MQITIEDITHQFARLLARSDSRESVSDWARHIREAADEGQVEYVPPSDESRIWDAILYLEGVDLLETATEYLHCEADFQTYLDEHLH